jgi:hypothetical protein
MWDLCQGCFTRNQEAWRRLVVLAGMVLKLDKPATMVLGFAAPTERVEAHLGLSIAHLIDDKRTLTR